jgi:hypothetical protein
MVQSGVLFRNINTDKINIGQIKIAPPMVGVPDLDLCQSTDFKISCPAFTRRKRAIIMGANTSATANDIKKYTIELFI